MVGPTSPMLHTKSQYHRSSGSGEEDALWSPAGKGLTSWLSFVVSNCESVIFPLVSRVRCDT